MIIENPDRTPVTTTYPGRTRRVWHWFYRPVIYDLRPLKGNGPGNAVVTGGAFTAQINNDQTNRTIAWPDGNRACIEERATRRTDEFLTPRHDMDIDLIPNPADPDTQWKPYLPAVVYARNVSFGLYDAVVTSSTNPNEDRRWIFSGLPQTSTRVPNGRVDNDSNFGPFGVNPYNYHPFVNAEGGCPAPARKLEAINRGQLSTYMDQLTPQGFTYHEIGMVWGLRLMSREGLFRAEHQAADANGAVQRHMIFMVDGQRDTRPYTYSAWGIAGTARRRTPTDRFPSIAMENEVSEDRLAELCEVAKNEKNITLWVIAFGIDLDDLLTNCASPGRSFEAANAAELTAAFTEIATRVADLRLTN
jgi:hypothetical protein